MGKVENKMYPYIVVGYFPKENWNVRVGGREIGIESSYRMERYYEDSWSKTLARVRSLGFFGNKLMGIIVYDKYGRVIKTVRGMNESERSC